jgi:RNA polymerase sigma-70 factor (ECF subfamily)
MMSPEAMTSSTPSLGLVLPAEDMRTDSSTGSDASLVERARTDPAAFAQIYRQHYSTLGAYLFRRSGDEHATEDMLAEVFLAAIQGLHRFRDRGLPVRFWLYRIATNVANRRWRELSRRAEGVGAEIDADTCARDAGPAEEAVRDESRRAAQRALLALPAELQSVLSLYYFQDLCVEDIARVLECPEGTVKSRLSRARDAFTLALQRRNRS